MLLSSEAEVKDRVRGLKTGADEYVGKPYDQSYVVARALELLRKSEPEGTKEKSTTVLIIDDSRDFSRRTQVRFGIIRIRRLTARKWRGRPPSCGGCTPGGHRRRRRSSRD